MIGKVSREVNRISSRFKQYLLRILRALYLVRVLGMFFFSSTSFADGIVFFFQRAKRRIKRQTLQRPAIRCAIKTAVNVL